MNFNSNFFRWETESQDSNDLIEYIQKQNPETLERIARSVSVEIKDIITQNVRGLLGQLPSESFGIGITTDRDNLANLLASAMMTGYFLGQVEKRQHLDAILANTESIKFNKKPDLE